MVHLVKAITLDCNRQGVFMALTKAEKSVEECTPVGGSRYSVTENGQAVPAVAAPQYNNNFLLL